MDITIIEHKTNERLHFSNVSQLETSAEGWVKFKGKQIYISAALFSSLFNVERCFEIKGEVVGMETNNLNRNK